MRFKAGKFFRSSAAAVLLLFGGVGIASASGEDLSAWGSYGPCGPGAISRTKASHVVEVSKSLANVPTDGIDVIECRGYTGMGPTNIVDCGGRPYSYCLLNDNDGAGNYIMLGVREEKMLLWNKLGSVGEIATSEIGPGFQLTSYKFADWHEAQIVPAKFGNGLFVNHDIGEGWTNDGGNFFAANLSDTELTPAKGTIEFWFTFKYDSSTHNHAHFFLTANALANHFPNGNYHSNVTLVGGWNGWDYGSYGKRFFFQIRNNSDSSQATVYTPNFSAAPSGKFGFADGTTAHFAFVYDLNGIDGTSDTARIYINGELSGSSTEHWSVSGGLDPWLYLGTTPNQGTWDHDYNAVKGITDNLIIWNYAKTDNACGVRDLPANTWLMTAPSCQPVDPPGTGIDAQYGNDIPGGVYGTNWISWKWDAASQRYPGVMAGTAPLVLGAGNWVYSLNAGTLVLDGTAAPIEPCSNYGSGLTGQCFAIDLVRAAGSSLWQIVGHPFPYTVSWADVLVAASLDGGVRWTTYTPSQAETASLMDKAIHRWSGSTYEAYDDSTPSMIGTLQPQDAFWVRIKPGSLGLSGFKLLIPAR